MRGDKITRESTTRRTMQRRKPWRWGKARFRVVHDLLTQVRRPGVAELYSALDLMEMHASLQRQHRRVR